MPWVYIVQCADGAYYTGSTALEDVEARVWEHNNDDHRGANFTRSRRPVCLVFAEFSERTDDVFAREKQIQGWSRAKKKALIEGDWARIVELSRGKS